ncbi:glycosyl transferase family 1 [Litchfieldella qijiaojingensis]|uniref:tRNA-queuosine alpha-mannosyltransferase n=1 Tax=Litchfieldella qijiaojingensis TaxID=980347 RepID=A0ABQ2Z9L3_9GAMM|nr:DUF3524 domain-containing protein [Halomonas qijiaojingensis]GGY06985.1 glycosyl transferase family 1 [Halomonas qijiaojingensis]
MKGLLLSAYAAVSHRHWAQGICRHVDAIDWQVLELPPRHFSWRIRGNPLTWMLEASEVLERHYDVVLATSMVDLATLVGLHPHLGRARKIIYFHENQFAYPLSVERKSAVEAQMVNLYSALTADRVVFNTAYNRDSFLDGVRRFLKRMPEKVRIEATLERLARDAQVLPVPIDPAADELPPRCGRRIVWNHRWEYDKNPEDFFQALHGLKTRGIDFEVAVMGQRFRQQPEIFEEARVWLNGHLLCWGPQPEATYREILEGADIVVSTTFHEFQGLSIMEAVQRGCVPLVPDRLCFPELYPSEYRYDGTRENLEARLERWLTRPDTRPAPPDASAWEWPNLSRAYRRLFME